MVVPDLEAMPESLLRSPLDFLFADHFRQMLVCNFLDALAANPKIATSARMAKATRDYLAQELPLHIADENDDLFPRLMRVTTPDDRFSNIYMRSFLTNIAKTFDSPSLSSVVSIRSSRVARHPAILRLRSPLLLRRNDGILSGKIVCYCRKRGSSFQRPN